MRFRGLVLLATVLVASCGKAPPPGPTSSAPLPGGTPRDSSHRLFDVSFIDARHGWAVEWVCSTRCPLFVARSTDGGATWQDAGSITSIDVFHSPAVRVRFSSTLDGYVAIGAFNETPPEGDAGLFATHDGGKTWQRSPVRGVVTALLPAPDTDEALTSDGRFQ